MVLEILKIIGWELDCFVDEWSARGLGEDPKIEREMSVLFYYLSISYVLIWILANNYKMCNGAQGRNRTGTGW